MQVCGQTADSLSVIAQDTVPAIDVDVVNDTPEKKLIKESVTDQDSILSIDDNIIREPVKEDSIVGFFSLFKGEPGKAALYSLVIPGGGQAYNRRWWKVPLAIGADAGAITVAVLWTQQYNKASNQYIDFLNGEMISGITNRSTLQNRRDTFRKNRDYAWFAVGILHIVTVVEAFVDRHLLEFDMNEDLSLEVIAIKDPYSVTLASVNYRF